MPDSSRVAYLGQVVHREVDEYGPIDVVDENDGRLRSLQYYKRQSITKEYSNGFIKDSS